MKKQCEETRFLQDVQNHVIHIVQDCEVYRHIVFKKPETSSYMFGIVTWPWHLAYYGDMGDYMFTRIDDMFKFFRTDRRGEEKLYINPGYWSEKCVASCRDGIEEFSKKKFKVNVVQYLNDTEASKRVRKAVVDDVFQCIADGEHAALRSVEDFNEQGFRFEDFWECDNKEYTFRFLWCCYAISWGIKKYDEAKLNATIRC